MAQSRRPGLQSRWSHVFLSLESIIPIYETGSTRIAMFSDSEMREEVVRFAVPGSDLVLDVGSGPGTLAKVVSRAGGTPVLLDASRRMLLAAGSDYMVQAAFEALPFRDEAFKSVVAGFSIRDSRDLITAIEEIRRVTARGGRFGFCDLGKSDSFPKALMLGAYVRVAVPLIGLATGGMTGLKFASLYDTYLLTLPNNKLAELLRGFFSKVDLKSRALGGSIVVSCVA